MECSVGHDSCRMVSLGTGDRSHYRSNTDYECPTCGRRIRHFPAEPERGLHCRNAEIKVIRKGRYEIEAEQRRADEESERERQAAQQELEEARRAEWQAEESWRLSQQLAWHEQDAEEAKLTVTVPCIGGHEQVAMVAATVIRGEQGDLLGRWYLCAVCKTKKFFTGSDLLSEAEAHALIRADHDKAEEQRQRQMAERQRFQAEYEERQRAEAAERQQQAQAKAYWDKVRAKENRIRSALVSRRERLLPWWIRIPRWFVGPGLFTGSRSTYYGQNAANLSNPVRRRHHEISPTMRIAFLTWHLGGPVIVMVMMAVFWLWLGWVVRGGALIAIVFYFWTATAYVPGPKAAQMWRRLAEEWLYVTTPEPDHDHVFYSNGVCQHCGVSKKFAEDTGFICGEIGDDA